jgi:hypothetical protein
LRCVCTGKPWCGLLVRRGARGAPDTRAARARHRRDASPMAGRINHGHAPRLRYHVRARQDMSRGPATPIDTLLIVIVVADSLGRGRSCRSWVPCGPCAAHLPFGLQLSAPSGGGARCCHGRGRDPFSNHRCNLVVLWQRSSLPLCRSRLLTEHALLSFRLLFLFLLPSRLRLALSRNAGTGLAASAAHHRSSAQELRISPVGLGGMEGTSLVVLR